MTLHSTYSRLRRERCSGSDEEGAGFRGTLSFRRCSSSLLIFTAILS